MKKLNAFLLIFVLHYIQAGAQHLPSFVSDSMDQYVTRALSEWKIPGAAVAIIKDGAVVFIKGYGVKETGTSTPVDAQTLFMIGSNTKAFTATGLAMLDADGKMSLDDHVQKWLPDFTLYDPWVAKEATVRDLLCHRLGFETFQGDFMFFDSDLSTQEAREKFGKLKPKYGFRSRWGYTNAAFMTAGQIFPKVSGYSWAQFLHDSLFVPLDMNRTLALSPGKETENIAAAHTVVNGKVIKIPYGRLDNLAPAGAISSSASDLTHWVMMQLDNGKYMGRQVVPARAIAQTRTPASILGNGQVLFNNGHFELYGLGWFLQEYNGKKLVSHTGGVNGFVTSITLVPEEKLGIIVLTNTDANNFYEALKWDIMDAFMGLPYRNYSKVYLSFSRQNELGQKKWLQEKNDSAAMHLSPALPLAQFAGDYIHEVYGHMQIAYKDNLLTATFEHHKGRYAQLQPLGGNRFLATFNDPLYGTKIWPFTISNGKVQSVTVTVNDFVEFTPYEFIRQGH